MTSQTDIRAAKNVCGTVKWFDPVKGFGFVMPDGGGPDVLLHANVLRNFGQSSVADGATIDISVLETERGLQVIEVLKVTVPEGPDDVGFQASDNVHLAKYDDLELEPARVKWFDKGKGYGFANVFGSLSDIFIHVEVLRRSGLADLQAGEAICLAVEDGERGHTAVLVKAWDSVIDSDTE